MPPLMDIGVHPEFNSKESRILSSRTNSLTLLDSSTQGQSWKAPEWEKGIKVKSEGRIPTLETSFPLEPAFVPRPRQLQRTESESTEIVESSTHDRDGFNWGRAIDSAVEKAQGRLVLE